MHHKHGLRKPRVSRAILFSLVIALTLLTAAAQAAAAPGDLSDGNGDMEVYAGANTGDPTSLVFAIQGADVYEVDSGGANNLVFAIVGEDLNGPDGCTSEPGLSTGSTVLVSATGEALYTVKGRHLWYGAVDVPDEGASGWEDANSQRAYDVWQNQFYAGPKGKTDALISSTADLVGASPLRKLALMAMVEGTCGATGLEPRPTPQ